MGWWACGDLVKTREMVIQLIQVRLLYSPHQVVQLLVRAVSRSTAWVEDELHSVVTPLCSLCTTHRIPLVRLGSLQALQKLVEQSRGHLVPFKKQIEKATRAAVEDRRREVRLVAVACLNAWHCGAAPAD